MYDVVPFDWTIAPYTAVAWAICKWHSDMDNGWGALVHDVFGRSSQQGIYAKLQCMRRVIEVLPPNKIVGILNTTVLSETWEDGALMDSSTVDNLVDAAMQQIATKGRGTLRASVLIASLSSAATIGLQFKGAHPGKLYDRALAIVDWARRLGLAVDALPQTTFAAVYSRFRTPVPPATSGISSLVESVMTKVGYDQFRWAAKTRSELLKKLARSGVEGCARASALTLGIIVRLHDDAKLCKNLCKDADLLAVLSEAAGTADAAKDALVAAVKGDCVEALSDRTQQLPYDPAAILTAVHKGNLAAVQRLIARGTPEVVFAAFTMVKTGRVTDDRVKEDIERRWSLHLPTASVQTCTDGLDILETWLP